MTKDPDKQHAVGASYADDIARGKELVPGKDTRADDLDAPPVYNILTPAERTTMIEDLRFRIVAGFARSDIAITKLEILTILKKPQDMGIAMSLLYDGALSAVSLWAGKTLTALKNNAVAKHDVASGVAAEIGDVASVNRAIARRDAFARVTDDDIKMHVGTLTGFARFQGRGAVAAAFADTSEKRQELNYLPQLQREMGKAAQQLSENLDQFSDAQLIVLHQAMDADNTTVDGWYRIYDSKMQRFKASGIDRIGEDMNIIEGNGPKTRDGGGAGDWVGREDIDRRVVWVTHEDGITKSLWFYETSKTHLPVSYQHLGRPDASRLTHLVGDGSQRGSSEFWAQAVMLSEQRHGEPVQTLPDSPETRRARGVSTEAIERKREQQEQQDLSKRTVRLFGGLS